MSVKNETVTNEAEQIVDDISNQEPVAKDEAEVVDDVMAALKAKMAAKKESEKKDEKMTVKIIEKKRRSVEFGFFGAGHAGSRLSEAFASAGYQAVCCNTAQQDLSMIKMPESNKLLLNYTAGGAARDRSLGSAAIEAYRDEINNLIVEHLDKSQVYVFCSSLSGGSGSGAIIPAIDILSEHGRPIIVLAVLPMSSDDGKQNALTALSELTGLLQSKKIANLIVVDNSKMESLYSDVASVDLFDFTNAIIAKQIDDLNIYSASPSRTVAFDSMEFLKVICDSGGLSTFGSTKVSDYLEPTSLAECLINDLQKGLLTDGFSLDQAKYGGIVFTANKEIMKQIPSSAINYAMSIVKETCPSASVFKGIYEDDSIGDFVKIDFIFSGMGIPENRVNQLKNESREETAKGKARDEKRNLTLNLDVGIEKNASDAEKVREILKNKGSVFNKNFVGIKDFRKK